MTQVHNFFSIHTEFTRVEEPHQIEELHPNHFGKPKLLYVLESKQINITKTTKTTAYEATPYWKVKSYLENFIFSTFCFRFVLRERGNIRHTIMIII